MLRSQNLIDAHKWDSNIKNWSLIKDETAKLIIEQGSTVIKETCTTDRILSETSHKILSVIFTIGNAMVIYLVNYFSNEEKSQSVFALSACLILIVLAISFYHAIKNFHKYEISVPGLYPKDLLNTDYIHEKFTDRLQYLNMVMSVGEKLQQSISFNNEVNGRHSANNHKAQKWLFAILVCPVAAFVLLHLYLNYYGLA